MIRKKNADGTYECEANGMLFNVPGKKYYEDEKVKVLATPQPSDKELIELGKTIHPFYQKDLAILNIDNNIKEIEEFEKKDGSHV